MQLSGTGGTSGDRAPYHFEWRSRGGGWIEKKAAGGLTHQYAREEMVLSRGGGTTSTVSIAGGKENSLCKSGSCKAPFGLLAGETGQGRRGSRMP